MEINEYRVRSVRAAIMMTVLASFALGCIPAAGSDSKSEAGYPRAATEPEGCVDKDGDLFGVGCYLGEDCDDNDPAITNQCLTEEYVMKCDGFPEYFHVSVQGGDDSNDGSQASPLRTIDRALELAEDCSDIKVAAGTYNEMLYTKVSLYGGFDPTGWANDLENNETVIAGLPGQDVTVEVDGRTDVTIDGFTIIGPDSADCTTLHLNPSGDPHNSGNLTITRNKILGGTCDYESTAIASGGPLIYLTVENNYIHGGYATDTIAVWLFGADINLLHNSINAGTAAEEAIGVHGILTGGVRLFGNTVLVTSGSYPTAVLLEGASEWNLDLDATNNVLYVNSAQASYNPLVIDQYESSLLLKHNLLWSGPGSCVFSDGSCIVNSEQANACDTSICPVANGNIVADPLLADAAGGDIHLLAASPAIDAGTASDRYSSDVDYEGDPRPYGSGLDIGVDEYVP